MAETHLAKRFEEYDNLLVNGSVESVAADSGVPRGWIVNPKSAIVTSNSDENDARAGKHSLRIQSSDKTHVQIAQSLHLRPSDMGKNASVWAWAQCSKGWMAGLSIAYRVNGKTESTPSKPWMECADEWTPLKVDAVIPANADPDSVIISVLVKPRARGTCRFDAFMARIEGRTSNPTLLSETKSADIPTTKPEVRPQPQDSTQHQNVDSNCVVNGSFEMQDENGRPNGWGISPKEFRAKNDSVMGTAKSGTRIVSLQGGHIGGAMFADIKIPNNISTRTLDVTAFGKASEANALYIAVRPKSPGGSQELCRVACPPSTNEWAEMHLKAEIPQSVDMHALQLVVQVPPNTTGTVAVDDVIVSAP